VPGSFSEEEKLKFYLVLAALVISALVMSSCITINTGGGATTTPGTTTTPDTAAPPATVTPPPPAIPFEDRTWVLERLGKRGAADPAIEGKEVTARFDTATDQVSGTAGCNSYHGPYNKNNDKLDVGSMVSTKMLCFPAAVNQQESLYLNILKGAQNYKVDGNSLTIFSTEDRILVFRAK